MTLDNLDRRLKYYPLVMCLPAGAEITAYPLPVSLSEALVPPNQHAQE